MFPDRPVTLGSPLPTYYTYILDDTLQEVEDGQSGEICIGGPGVALGYHNRPDLTQQHFIPNPVLRDREMVSRLFRTGDIGRVTPAGEIEYLGRIDTRIPMRGYRSELDEIEQLAFPQASSALLYETIPASLSQNQAVTELGAETSRLQILQQLDLKNVYRHVMTDPLYRNSLFNMASTFMLGGLGFVFWIIIARLYKPENVGIATTLISIMTLLTSFTLLGLNSSLNRYLPKSTNKNELVNSSLVLVTLVTLGVTLLFLLGLRVFSPQLVFLQSNLFYMVSFAVFVIFCACNSLVDSTFMAFRSASDIFLKNSIISVLKLLLPFAFIALGAYGIFASTASALTIGVLTGIALLVLKFKIRPSLSVNISLVRETSVYSFANYVVGFMFNMPSLVLPVIILNVLSAKYAAYYYIASMIQNILLIIPLATAQALLTEGAYNEAGLKKHVKKALVTILITLVPATAIIVFGGNFLLQFFGKSYATEAFTFLQLYSISTIFAALILVANAILNVKHQTKWLLFSNIFASVLTLWLSYAFISGKLVGIGWGWTLGQAIAGIVSLILILKVFFESP
jgi:O-antigen/teichoic acid export membrane protein